jgi:hypothetical protein
MRSLAQIQRSNQQYASRAAALSFVEKCLKEGPQAVYEPGKTAAVAAEALSRGWVYVEMLPVAGADGSVQRYVSNLTIANVKELQP